MVYKYDLLFYNLCRFRSNPEFFHMGVSVALDILKFGFKYWKKRMPMAIFCQIMGYVGLTATLLLPQLTQLIIDFVIDVESFTPEKMESSGNLFMFLVRSGEYGAPGSTELFFSLAGVFLILLAVRIVLLYVRNNLFIRNGLKMETDLRNATYTKLTRQSNSILSRYSTGELLNIMNGDIVSFKELFAFVFLIIADAVFMLVVVVYLLARINPALIIIPLSLSPFLIVTLRKFMRAARDISAEIRNRNADMNMTVSENINAVRLIRSFTSEETELKKFDKRNEATKNTYFRHADIISSYTVLFNIMRQVAYIGSIAVGTLLILRGHLTVGSLVAFTGYVLNIMDNITNINNFMFTAQQQLVSGGRLLIFLETGNIIDELESPEQLSGRPHIATEELTLVMDDHTLLKNVTLDVPPGKKLGIMGGTGSGKTVLLKTLSRFMDATSGRVMINGEDVRKYPIEDVRRQFSFVFQDVFLFSNTIDANIAYYDPEADRERVRHCAETAQATSFIESMPDGYETVIGERGFGLSGGQRQRVSVARALLKDAPVLVLDDSTSALDTATEKKLLDIIQSEFSEKTILISAHRASSVAFCDEIIYMQDGEIIERGSFDELMAMRGNYYSIYAKQSADGEEQPLTQGEAAVDESGGTPAGGSES